MSETPLHDWLRPRVDLVMNEAAAAGFEKEAVLAVLSDIISATAFPLAPPPAEPAPTHETWPVAAEPVNLDPALAAPELSHGRWPDIGGRNHIRPL